MLTAAVAFAVVGVLWWRIWRDDYRAECAELRWERDQWQAVARNLGTCLGDDGAAFRRQVVAHFGKSGRAA